MGRWLDSFESLPLPARIALYPVAFVVGQAVYVAVAVALAAAGTAIGVAILLLAHILAG